MYIHTESMKCANQTVSLTFSAGGVSQPLPVEEYLPNRQNYRDEKREYHDIIKANEHTPSGYTHTHTLCS